MHHDAFLDELTRHDIGTVRRHELLRDHGHWRIGGPADLLIEPHCIEHIQAVLECTRSADVPLVVIGDGCNLLFADEGVRGVVMKIGRQMSHLSVVGSRVHAEAGAWIPGLARTVGALGLSGIEHVVGIPSSLGGLIVMNGGSLRRCIGEVVTWVDIIEPDGRQRRMPKEACGFRRRVSVFQTSSAIVVAAELKCERGDPRAIRRAMLEILRSRRKKFPLKLPNCGSVFVSGGEIYERFGPPGAVIEQAGLKGLRLGDAQVSHKHANYIVNLGKATAAQVLELIRRVRQTTYDRTQVWMDCEVRYVSPDGEIRPAHEALPEQHVEAKHP
jgi:UDP-N-acetylmuramate dehydrogenase